MIDMIVFSPPYAVDVKNTHMVSVLRGNPNNPNYRPSWQRKINNGYLESERPYSIDKNNIGMLPYDD